jgi:hypothetical protein
MVGIIQCSRIYGKRMSSKGLTSIGRRVAVCARRVVAAKNFIKLGRCVVGR